MSASNTQKNTRTSIHDPSGGAPGKKPRNGINAKSSAAIQLATANVASMSPREVARTTITAIAANTNIIASKSNAMAIVDPARSIAPLSSGFDGLLGTDVSVVPNVHPGTRNSTDASAGSAQPAWSGPTTATVIDARQA